VDSLQWYGVPIKFHENPFISEKEIGREGHTYRRDDAISFILPYEIRKVS
jgi:hypothetical protein